jgi:hypothetical protein
MNENHGNTSGAGDRGRTPRSNDPRALYVINLFSSLMPMPLEIPNTRGLEGLAVFRSRRLEDGRERFRLHLGYFESRADAEAALEAIQRDFPGAWVASAPRSGLGSLDDTNLSEFRLIRSPTSLVGQVEAGRSAVTLPESTQRYVVQLNWTSRRVDPAEIPQFAIFRAYTLYTVTLMRAGVRFYGIRLGFFTSAISARQVALYLRREFPSVAVLPISEREYGRAREMIEQREIRAAPPPEAVASQPSTPAPDEAAATESASLSAADAVSDVPADEVDEPAYDVGEPAESAPSATSDSLQTLTEAYVAEAATRLSDPSQTGAFTREELLAALGDQALQGNDAARRSALARLLRRLADRIG